MITCVIANTDVETDFPNSTIEIYYCENLVSTVVTDNDGNFTFPSNLNLPSYTYKVNGVVEGYFQTMRVITP